MFDIKRVEDKKSTKRKLLYIDTFSDESDKIYKISMFEQYKNAIYTLELKEVTNGKEAKMYAIYYAILYIKKHGYKNYHILCDSEKAVYSEDIRGVVKRYNIGLSWIPREANVIADKIATLDPTLKEKEWNMLKLFVELIQNSDKKKIRSLKAEIKRLKTVISNQAKKIKKKEKVIQKQSKKLKKRRK
jgi:ribonuclease HI